MHSPVLASGLENVCVVINASVVALGISVPEIVVLGISVLGIIVLGTIVLGTAEN